jgi:cell wall-associated NlpC family hydrolase
VHQDAGDTAPHFAGEATLRPCGYSAPLIGREFVHGIQDCFTLIADWYERERGIILPNFHRDDNWWLNGENLYLDNYEKAGFRAVDVGSNPEPGDVFLMQVRSRVPNHAGIYIGNGMFIHHLYRQLSRRDVYGGPWAEKTRLVVRYFGGEQ